MQGFSGQGQRVTSVHWGVTLGLNHTYLLSRPLSLHRAKTDSLKDVEQSIQRWRQLRKAKKEEKLFQAKTPDMQLRLMIHKSDWHVNYLWHSAVHTHTYTRFSSSITANCLSSVSVFWSALHVLFFFQKPVWTAPPLKTHTDMLTVHRSQLSQHADIWSGLTVRWQKSVITG